jgi:RHS repeat-associated protein
VESSGSTKQFIWCADKMCEARDGSSTLLNQYFLLGQTISGSNYLYTRDHLGSVREMTDSSGNIQAQYSYDPYGRVTQLQGSLASDFQFAGYYFHAPSGLSLAVHRAYNSNSGRWISRDPIKESGGNNLYDYVRNTPVNFSDPSGLECCPKGPKDPDGKETECAGLPSGVTPKNCYKEHGKTYFRTQFGGTCEYIPENTSLFTPAPCAWQCSPPMINQPPVQPPPSKPPTNPNQPNPYQPGNPFGNPNPTPGNPNPFGNPNHTTI